MIEFVPFLRVMEKGGHSMSPDHASLLI